MQIELLIDQLPLWLFYVVTVVIVFLSVASGFRLGSYIRRRHEKGENEAPVGTIVGAMLGLLAFILAFTFGIAASRFDDRKRLLLDEVNTIGTVFLRADFLPEPQRTETRMLLKKYVDIRADVAQHPEKLKEGLRDSEAVQDQLWSRVSGLANQPNPSRLLGLYIQSLNDLIDLHSKRLTVALQYRIPASIWFALYFVAILAMAAVGYHLGISGPGSFWISLVLAFVFSAVMLLVADLDRTTEGFLTVSQRPMIELQQKLGATGK